MTLHVFPDPRVDVYNTLAAAKPDRWPTAVIDSAFPNGDRATELGAAWPLAEPWIQFAWDGTPTEEQVRERCTIRITVWTPDGEVSDGIDLASLVRAVLLDAGSSDVWRYTRGPGRSHGTDPDTGLPFATFILTAETRPHAVA